MTKQGAATAGPTAHVDVNRSIIETAMDGFWLATPEGRLLEVNEAYCRMSGYSRSELLGMQILDLDIGVDQLPGGATVVKRVIEQGEHRFETRHRRKDGSNFDVEASVQYRPEAEGQLVMFLRDITRRKGIAEALRASEARYRSMLNTSPDVVALIDLQGRIQMASPAVLKLLRCEREDDLLGRPLTDFLVPGDRSRALERIAGILGGAPPSPTEYMGLRPDGSTVAVEVNSQFIRGADGRPTEMILLIRDISARRMVDAALRASEERYRSILNASPDNITITDLSARIVMVSPVGLRTMGYTKEAEVVGRPLHDFIAQEERPRAAENIALMFQGILTGPVEYRGRRADGSAIDLEVNGEFIRGSEGEPTELVFIVRDITERKRAQAKLRTSEALHRTILQTAMDGFWVVDRQGRLIDVNEAYCGMSGYSAAELLTMGVADLSTLENAEGIAARIQRIMERGSQRFESRHRRKDGSLFAVETSVQYLPLEEGRLVAFLRDVTEQKRAEELLRLSLKEKEGLLREVHHRVKNNLQVISSLLRLEISRSVVKDTKRVLQDMQGRIVSMAVLHETLYRSGRFGQVELGGYLKNLAQQLLRATSSSTRVNLNLDINPVALEVDQAIPCGLILNELLTNSLKHAFAEGTGGEVRVRLTQDAQGEVRLAVADTGVGLPSDFEMKRSRSLGLQLVTDLARQIGGRFDIDPGPGAQFRVTFTPVLHHATIQSGSDPSAASPTDR